MRRTFWAKSFGKVGAVDDTAFLSSQTFMRKICIRVKIRSNRAFISSFLFTEFRLHTCEKLELRESVFPFPFREVFGSQLTQSYSFWTHEKWDGHGTSHDWGRRKMHRGFECGNMQKRDHWKDMCVGGIILNRILKIEWVSVDWVDLAQGSGK